MSDPKLKVLVADDSSTVHSLFAEIAKASPIPFEIVHAHDGRQCMEMLDETIQLAFIDVNMPEMSGMEAVGAARRIGNKTFVTLMSSDANKRRQQLALQLKVYEFLLKPFSPEQIVAILKIYRRVTAPSKALVVDDSATVRTIIRKVLNNSIFTIEQTEVGNGALALAHCDSYRYDVVFLDGNMPVIDGYQTLDRLLTRDPSVKVVMISSERNEERRKRALDRGATAFLHKPFYPADIDRELHAIFGLRMPQLAGIEPGPREQAGHGQPAADLLLYDRLHALHLEPEAIKRQDPGMMQDLEGNCSVCGAKVRCGADLKRHPDEPGWQEYCPNAATLTGLAQRG
jgi:CheY-like chemotaxis protein